ILVDYPGVGSSTGEPSRTIAEAARRMIAFVGALGLDRVDLLGFSIGGFVAPAQPTGSRQPIRPARGRATEIITTETPETTRPLIIDVRLI
ncbi:MAG TPA: alpha/beta fold hydrolase, partial [Gaiellaceae bacterium]